jgi:hypothetical protein
MLVRSRATRQNPGEALGKSSNQTKPRAQATPIQNTRKRKRRSKQGLIHAAQQQTRASHTAPLDSQDSKFPAFHERKVLIYALASPVVSHNMLQSTNLQAAATTSLNQQLTVSSSSHLSENLGQSTLCDVNLPVQRMEVGIETQFRVCKRENPLAISLLRLLSLLGGKDIPLMMLGRACLHVEDWNGDGQIVQRSYLYDDSTRAIFPNEEILDKNINFLEDHRCITKGLELRWGCGYSKSLTVDDDWRKYVVGSTQNNKWQVRALSVLFHAFPKDNYLDKL